MNDNSTPESVVDVAAVVNEPPSTFADETLEHQLRPDPPSRRALRATKVLAFGATLVVGVLLGVVVDRQWGPTSGTTDGTFQPGAGLTGPDGGFPDGTDGPPDGFGPPPATTNGTTP